MRPITIPSPVRTFCTCAEKQGKFTEDVATYFLACMLEGLGAIHDVGYVYRDMKPENVLLSAEGHCKISDLGLATKVSPDGIKSGAAGTRGYWPPEMLIEDDDGNCPPYNLTVDFWSLGCVAYALFVGTSPFLSKDIKTKFAEIYAKDKKKAIDEATKVMVVEYPESNFTAKTKAFTSALLVRDPTKRLGIAGWKEVKKHDFFSSFDFDKLVKGNMEPPFVVSATFQNDYGLPFSSPFPFSIFLQV